LEPAAVTTDAIIDRDAPILGCTAEILGNIAVREGEHAWIDDVVMDATILPGLRCFRRVGSS
jgi:superfamily II RNA helicase